MLLCSFFCAPQLDAQQKSEAVPGKPAPALDIEKWLEPRDAGPHAWHDLRGKVVVVEFWATWCGPCVAAIPHLNELVEKFENQPAQFISVSDEDEAVVKKFLAARPIKGWLALDTDRSTFKGYGVEGIPTTVLVDKSGLIIGVTDPDQITAAVLATCSPAMSDRCAKSSHDVGSRRGKSRSAARQMLRGHSSKS